MDANLLLVNCITLLFQESYQQHGSFSTELCKEVINTIKVPESSVSMTSGRETIVGLRSTVYWMMDHAEEGFDKAQLLQRVRMNTKDDTYLYNAVVDGLTEPENTKEAQKHILSYRSTLREYLNGQKMSGLIAKAFNTIHTNGDDKINIHQYARELQDELDPYARSATEATHASVVDVVDISDTEAVERNLETAEIENSPEGALVTGWHGLNRMLGKPGGIRRGDIATVSALQYGFKSGFCLNLFKHFALYNEPYMLDNTRTPLLLHLSLENNMNQNLIWLVINLLENETGKVVDKLDITYREAAEYIKEKLKVNGYEISMQRIDPNKCTIHDLTEIILRYEAEGFEVHATIADYLSMLNKKGLDRSGPTGSEVRELFRRVRGITTPRKIAFITPHQLSTEAKLLKRQGVDNFLEQIRNKGYYDGSRTIDQELDLEIYLDREVIGEQSYLNVARGKHRGVDRTPERDQTFTIPFSQAGGIRDDLMGEDSSLSSPGGGRVAEGGGDWFDL